MSTIFSSPESPCEPITLVARRDSRSATASTHAPACRRSTPRRCGGALLLAVALAAPFAVGAQVVATKYVVTDLGSLGGMTANANGINNSGQVVGSSKTAGDAATRAYRTAPNKPIKVAADDLGTLGGAFSEGTSINASGQVAGRSATADVGPFGSTVTRAFRADPGAPMIDLGTLAPSGGVNGFNNSGANGINDAANVVGFATVPVDLCGSSSHAFRTFPGETINPAVSNLGTLVPYPYANCRSSTAYGVNSLSLTVGDSATNVSTGYPYHAFRYTPFGGMVDIGTLGGRDSLAYAVNDLGEIVGKSDLPYPATSPHAFMSQGSLIVSMIDIGTLGGSYSVAYAINKRYLADSQVVGDSTTSGDAAIHAFRYTGNVLNGGSMVDLNSLIAANSGWELISARGINDNGQIVGSGWRDGVKFVAHAYRLDPADVAVTILTASLSDAQLGLTDGQINSLTDKLQSAFNSIQQGLIKQAINQLNAFVSSVQTWAKNGKITGTTAASLTASANAILAVL